MIKYSFILLLIVQFSCRKEYKIENKTYCFLRGVLAVDYIPLFSVSQNNIEEEIVLSSADYELAIADENGKREDAKLGKFISTIIKENVTYTIYWKMKDDEDWVSFKCKAMDKTNSKYDSNKIVADDDLYLKTANNTSEFILLSDNANEQPPFPSTKIFNLFFLENGFFPGSKLALNSTESQITLWPPEPIYYSSPFFDKYCFKPFTNDILGKNSLNQYYIYQPVEMNKISSDNIKIMHQNSYNNNSQPLNTGLPLLYNYQKGNKRALVFPIILHPSFNINQYLKKEGIVKYQLINNDTNTYQFGGVNLDIHPEEESKYRYDRSLSTFSQKDSFLLYKDYLNSYSANPHVCGRELSLPAKLIISVTIINKITKQITRKYVDYLYTGKDDTFTYTIP